MRFDAEIGQLFGRLRRNDGFVAPPAHVLDEVAGREARGLAGDDLADGAAVHRLAELERGDVALHVVHPPAHVRIDREPMVADMHHAVAERRKRNVLQLEILSRGKPLRTAHQVPGTGHLHLLLPSLPSEGLGVSAPEAARCR